jgi:voltage-gated potassium channel
MNQNSNLRRFVLAFTFLFITVVIGVIGFHVTEDYSILDSLYMTVITMSTVGFGTVRDLSQEGKMFAIFLIIFSAGNFVYFITTLSAFVIEGEMKQLFSKYRIRQKVARLQNHIIICGLGRNGKEAALELIRQNQDFVIVEQDQSTIDAFLEMHDVLAIQGDATEEEVLERANIAHAKALISALATDAENVYITLTAREMNRDIRIISRASHESTIKKLKHAGANEVIAPNLIGGRKMANVITRPALVEYIDMVTGEGDPDLSLDLVNCGEYPDLVGKTLAELHIRARTGAQVVGYKQGERRIDIVPAANRMIEADDRLFVIGSIEQLSRFRDIYLKGS